VATILLTEQPDARYIEPYTVRRRDRLRARLSIWKLDLALARGASPDSSPALSLRANQLIGRNLRRRLAQELRELPTQAARPHCRLDAGVPICRQGVLRAVGLLEELAARLEGREPVDARGVAQVRALLTNADSPLFDPTGVEAFVRALRATLDSLEHCVSV
jgi:hypothetical protein